MGVVLSVFRRRKAYQVVDFAKKLEKLETKRLESKQLKRQLAYNRRRILTRLLTFFVVFFIISLVIYYFIDKSTGVTSHAIALAPTVAIAVTFYLAYKFVCFYYARRLDNAAGKVRDLKAEQQDLVEQLKQATNWTYTQNVIAKYDKAAAKRKQIQQQPPRTPLQTPGKPPANQPRQPPGSIRRPPPNTLQPPSTPQPHLPAPAPPATPIATPAQPPRTPAPTPATPGGNLTQRRPPLSTQPPEDAATPKTTAVPPTLKPPNRRWFDKVVDYLIGDGPDYSYALVCGQCGRQNGLIPKDETKNIQFSCRYCGKFNHLGDKGKQTAPAATTTAAAGATSTTTAPPTLRPSVPEGEDEAGAGASVASGDAQQKKHKEEEEEEEEEEREREEDGTTTTTTTAASASEDSESNAT